MKKGKTFGDLIKSSIPKEEGKEESKKKILIIPATDPPPKSSLSKSMPNSLSKSALMSPVDLDLDKAPEDIILIPIVSYKSKDRVKVRPESIESFNRGFGLNFGTNTEFIYYGCLIKLIVVEIPYFMVRFAFGIDNLEPIMTNGLYNTLEEALEINSAPARIFTKSDLDVYQFEKDKVKSVGEISDEIDTWLKTC